MESGHIFSPTYEPQKGAGKFRLVSSHSYTTAEALSDCKARGGQRLMPKPTDTFITELIPKYASLNYIVNLSDLKKSNAEGYYKFFFIFFRLVPMSTRKTFWLITIMVKSLI